MLQMLGRKEFWLNMVYYGAFPMICSLIFLISVNYTSLDNFIISIFFNPFAYVSIILWATQISKMLDIVSYSRNVLNFINGYENLGQVVCKFGAPGTGKSSSALYEASIQSSIMWYELCRQYWLYNNLKTIPKYRDNNDWWEEWEELEFSYNFYSTHNCAPCVYSNVPVRIDSQMVCVLSRDHLEQKIRIPAFTVLICDEVGGIVDVQEGNKKTSKPIEIDDMFRFCRQFGFQMYLTEQRSTNIYINIRGVISCNELMTSREELYKPLLLQRIFEHTLSKCVSKNIKSINKAIFLVKLKSLIGKLGFVHFTSTLMPNTEVVNIINQEREYYAFAYSNFEYNNRMFKNCYKARNNDIEADIWETLFLDEKNAELFIRARKNLTLQ